LTWLPLSLACALFVAISDALAKEALKSGNEYVVSLIRVAGGCVFITPLIFFRGWATPTAGFWTALLILLPLDCVSMLLYNRALKLSPLSLTVPFLAFTPVFLLLTSWAILGEAPTHQGLSGVVLVSLGGYLLNAPEARRGLLAPVRAVLREPGSRLMVAVAAVYSVSSSVGKVAVLASDPFLMPAIYFPALFAVLVPLVAKKSSGFPRAPVFKRLLLVTALGLFEALGSLTNFLAVQETHVTYMISVKRLSLLFAVLFGWLFFKEKNAGARLLGGSVMVLGVMLIAFR
jgi:drug/metabolite transporter (DMT)-like permease